MSNVARSRSAHQLFDKFTKRHPSPQTSPNLKTHQHLPKNHLNLVDPVEYFKQNDIVKSWTSKISSLVRQNRPHEAIHFFKSIVIKAVGSLDSKVLACGMIHGFSIKTGLIDSQVTVITALVGVYGYWDLKSAYKLFDQMPNKDVVLFSAMVSACVSNGEFLGAFKLLRKMVLFGVQPKNSLCCHIICRNSILDMYSKCGHLEAALKVFEHMGNKDIVSWRIIIRGCVENEMPRKALEIFFDLRAFSDEKAKFGNIDSARKIFDNLDSKDVIAYSAMIAVYAQSTRPDNAFDILRKMQWSDEKPNEFTFVSLLIACTSLDAVHTGECVHANIEKHGYSTNSFLTSALIDMYCKFGKTDQAEAVFDEKSDPKDLICWSSMINGYAINGYGDNVLECFSNMLSNGILPNDVIFISLLSACSHCGLEYEGWSWFRAMEMNYGIKPKLAHYACMVDMLSRQGNIEEAIEFVNNMPVEPDKRIWGTILAGCKNVGGPTEIMEFVAKKLIGLDPENTSYYVVLSNVYADQGKWEEVEKLRNVMDRKSLKKVVGYSLI
ncbi:pentatricopeptide repeat-containing protein at2g29760 chloroplastic [Phtheirospermum japonicum]|uniref:Pentatricopeptide repeat-containing protein at2g29760 chloroplastic n=1 Tax=Phtheirospermum japonicum TaxID=374723 RepID=A0A830BY91_9LAMI|nr:pentatricopeptide repeat-containing protein at2g29760 chloroplastic [Phtheirospermum japonicum]